MGKILMLIDGFILKLGLLYLASHDTMTAKYDLLDYRVFVAAKLMHACNTCSICLCPFRFGLVALIP